MLRFHLFSNRYSAIKKHENYYTEKLVLQFKIERNTACVCDKDVEKRSFALKTILTLF